MGPMSSVATPIGTRVARPLRVLEMVGNAIVGGMESAVLRLVSALPADDFA